MSWSNYFLRWEVVLFFEEANYDIFKRVEEASRPIIDDIYNDGFIQDLLAVSYLIKL